MKPIQRVLTWFGAAVLTAVLLAGCGAGQEPVMVEGTRPVTEAEPAAPEAIPEGESLEPVGEPILATGSEDGAGSPFPTGSGQKVAPNPASGGWIDLSQVPAGDRFLRLVNEGEAGSSLLYQRFGPGRLSTLMITPESLVFSRELAGLPPVSLIREPVDPALLALIDTLPETDRLAELSVQLRCDQCPQHGQGELLVLFENGGVIALTFDVGEPVAALEALVTGLRGELERSEAAAGPDRLRRTGSACCRLGR